MVNNIIQPHINKLRKDKFILILTLPNIFKQLETHTIREEQYVNLDSLQFSVYDVIIPQSSIPENPMHFGGQNYNVTSYNRPAYPPVRISFEVDNEFKNYWVLWKWTQLLNDAQDASFAGKNIFPNGAPKTFPTENLIKQYLYNYQTDIVVNSIDEYNKTKASFIFKHAFITRLGELAYSYREAEQLSCSFEFVFNQLEMQLI